MCLDDSFKIATRFKEDPTFFLDLVIYSNFKDNPNFCCGREGCITRITTKMLLSLKKRIKKCL